VRKKEKTTSKERQLRLLVAERIKAKSRNFDAVYQLNKFTSKWSKKKGDVTKSDEYQERFAEKVESAYQLVAARNREEELKKRISKTTSVCAICEKRYSKGFENREDD
jgi:hypothetical protein